jgi:hypothetical protein
VPVGFHLYRGKEKHGKHDLALQQVRLVELFRGPLAEQAALALADWGELFGRWRQEEGWLYQRKREAL